MSNKADNIFKFLKAFKNWESKNPLTPIQEKLLMRIMIRVNENHWKEWTPISNDELILETRITNRTTFTKNRDYLKNMGLIRYKKGSKGKRSVFGVNMPVAETTFVFPETKNNEDYVSSEIHKTTYENENNKDYVSPEIHKTVHNNSETPHEQCDPEPTKRINDKRINDIYLTSFDIYKLAQSDKITHELLEEPTEKIFIEIPLIGDKVYKMPEKLIDEYQELYTGIDVKQQVREYKAWTLSNPTKRKTERGILRSINLWLEKNQNRGNKNLSVGVNRDGKASYDIEDKSTDINDWI